LNKLPLDDRLRVRNAIDSLAAGLAGRDVLKLRGKENEWRLRVGRWRIRFRPDFKARVLVVLTVSPRSSAYRD
jgi:mRNA interferase RelE/StbE